MGKKLVILFGLLVVVIWLTMGNTDRNQEVLVIPEVNYKAPAFTLPALYGQEVSLEQYKGKPVFINFWASWCPPCRMETPDLTTLYEKYKNRIGFIGVNVTAQDDLENVNDFVNEFHVTFPIALDHSGEVSKQYKIIAMPTSYIVDKNGVIVFKKTGVVTKPEIEQVLERILKGEE
ncbi:TlpA family protein disulfide reductase [Brevibacillus sp. SYSU BS000544]|uniref:TlpA family protein disulfide reductase n=1 Tax=Brevibacillus sp. SYSU BS000544 TaxID=3416443 RepID=UPI003CE54B01